MLYVEAITDNEQLTEVDPGPDWLSMAQSAFATSTTFFDASIRPQIEADLRQAGGQHPNGSKYLSDAWRGKSKIFQNKTRVAIRKNEATAAQAFFSSEDVVAMTAEDDNNPLHQAAVEIFKPILQYRLQRRFPNGMPWFQICCGAMQEAIKVGVVISHNYWRKTPQNPSGLPWVELIPAENFRIDPACDWLDPVGSSPYVIHLIPMYVKDVKAKGESGEWHQVTTAALTAANSQANDTTRAIREGLRQDSKDQQSAITDYSIVWVHRNILEHGGQDWIYYTLGTEKLLSTPVPLQMRYAHGQRPYRMGYAILEPHKIYPDSLPRITRDSQAEINELSNLSIENAKMVLNKRYLVRRGRNVDLPSLTRNVSGSVTLVDESADVHIMSTPDITSSIYQERDRMNLQFDDMAGSFSGSSVMSNRRLNETVGGMNLISANTNLVTEYQLRTFVETWVEPTLQDILLLERFYETDENIINLARRTDKAGDIGFDQITKELLLQEVVLRVNVGIGSTNPQTQLERFVYGLSQLAAAMPQLMQRLNAEEVTKELFGKLGYKDGKRFFDAERPVDPMQQQLQEIELAIRTATLSKLEAETALKQVEAVNKRVEALFSSMQTAQTAVTVPGVTPVADAIAQSAGFQDQDTPPVYPQQLPQPVAPQVPAPVTQNTSPLYPASPSHGMLSGIEGGA